MNLYDNLNNNNNSDNNNNQNGFDIYKQSNYNNQYNNQQFYQVYNDSFKNTKYKKRPSAGIVVLIVILCFFGIWFILGLLSLAPTLDMVSTAKVGRFQNEAYELVTTARTYIVANNIQESGNFVFTIGGKNATWYPKNGTSKIVDNTLREDLIESAFGNKYKTAFVKVEYNHSGYYADFYLYLSDGKYCFNGIKEEKLNKEESLSKDCKNFISNPSTGY